VHFQTVQYALFLWSAYVLFWALQDRRRARHALLLAASWWFYGLYDWRFLPLLVLTSGVDFASGRGIEDARASGRADHARAWLALSLAANLGLLAFFKYWNFLAANVEALAALIGLPAELWRLGESGTAGARWEIPPGISFYTFQALSYTLDVWRGRLPACRSPMDFAVYVAFFPQLVAGPIVSARTFLPQLEARPVQRPEQLASGLVLIVRGLAKKLLVADVLGTAVVDRVFAGPASLTEAGAAGTLLASYAFALQVYGDFSGYSDIAIGSARLFGFELRKNFDAPYKSRSIEEFWTRWHISMSLWFYQYLFESLGGYRGRLARLCFNLAITHLVIGLWHGAAWSFVLWGAYWAVLMIASRLARRALPGGKLPDRPWLDALCVLGTFHVCLLSGIFFRAPDLESLAAALRALGDWTRALPSVPWQVWPTLALGYLSHFTPDRWDRAVERGFGRWPAFAQGLALVAAGAALLALAPPSLTPFIYFQF
jgi:D-alanyl-lipoteichoic acid acyltransferase DltB (MBOAT superfamily)